MLDSGIFWRLGDMISFEHVYLWPKTNLILCLSLGNLTIHLLQTIFLEIFRWFLPLKIDFESQILFNNLLKSMLIVGQNPTNFVSLPRKFDNPYYHNVQLQSAGTKFVWHIYYKLPHKVHKPCFNTCRQHSANLTYVKSI